jgi:hypothetical protein
MRKPWTAVLETFTSNSLPLRNDMVVQVMSSPPDLPLDTSFWAGYYSRETVNALYASSARSLTYARPKIAGFM